MGKLGFLFAAYLLIWIALAIYLFSLHRRQRSLEQQIAMLRRAVEEKK